MKRFKVLPGKERAPLKGMRMAIESDFRSPLGLFICNMEYYEFMLDRTFELNITDEETDRDWLKQKIAFGFIQIPVVPVYWNQNPIKEASVLSA